MLLWDITLLLSTIISRYNYLYVFMDVRSKRILAVEEYGEKCGKLTPELYDRISRDEEINKKSAPMV